MPRAKYGSVKKVEDAKRALPVADMRPSAASTAPSAVDPAQAMLAAQQFAPPQMSLGAPSARPGENVTAGIGDPSLGGPAPAGPNPDVIAMARHLPMLEALASRPGSSATTRAFVRRLRSMLPPDFEF